MKNLATKTPGSPDAATQREIAFAGQTLVLDAQGALLLADGTLIVADLHLEKASRHAARGRPLPPFDTQDTLARLSSLLGRTRPRRVVCLGDSFDDDGAPERLTGADRATIEALCAGVSDWIWVDGNHDPSAARALPGRRVESLTIGGIRLAHAPRPPKEGQPPAQIVGHFHPVAGVAGRVRGRCFSVSALLLVMPAFGAYAGGLSSHHRDLLAWHETPPADFLLYRGRIWPLGSTLHRLR